MRVTVNFYVKGFISYIVLFMLSTVMNLGIIPIFILVYNNY